MKINRSFARCGRKIISVALCLVMMFTTFFIFEPSVLSELLPKASAWNFTTYATSTGGNKAGLTINTSAKTAIVNTSDGFAYFLNSINHESNSGKGEFQGYTVTLNCDVFLQKSQTDLEGITYSDGFYSEKGTAWYGVLDGNGHCISNFRYHYDGKRNFTIGCTGLIKKMSGGEIKNLTLLNPHVYTYNRRSEVAYGAGALIGKISSDSNSMFSTVNISNVTVSGAEVETGSKNGAKDSREAGGLVGFIEKKTTFSNCKVENSKIQRNNGGVRDGGFVGKSTAEVIIQNDTPAVSVDSSTIIFVDGWNDSDHGGLIGWTSGKTTIKNVIMDATAYSGQSGGGFIGYIQNAEANITNSTMSGKVGAKNNCGGFIGNSSGATFNISNCKNSGTVTGNDNVGGIIGSGSGKLTMDQCNNTGTVTGNKYVGGIVGRAAGNTVTITNSTNEGEITANNDYIGGIIGGIDGINSSKFENCTNSGTITGKTWYIGGIVGASINDSNITFNNCKNTVNISSPTNRYVGGIVGYAKGKTMMNNCVNTGNISGAQFTAGLCAWIQDDGCEITNCLNTGTVSTNGNSNGAGILSTVERQANNPTWKITNCVNTGDIKNGVSAIGGILGYMGDLNNPGTVIISDCINKGNMAVSGNDVGGIVGNLYSHGSPTQHHKYINCYNYGNISSNSGSTDGVFVGGIVGKEYGFAEFNGCRNYGTVNASSTSANSISGGICGWIEDDISSFADCINYGNVTAKNNIGGILGEVSNAYNGTTFSFTKCGNYGNLSATTNNFADMGGIVGKLNAKESTVKIYMSKCFNGNGKDGRIASVSYKAKNAGGLFGEVNQQAVIADSYNNASSISSSTYAGGLIGTNNRNTTLAYNSFSVTGSVSKLEGSGKDPGYISTTGCFTNTMSKGKDALATLNTTRPVSGISSVGDAYDYKQGVNNDYPALKWQLNTLTKNVGRNLIADLIADTAKSGYSAQGSSYSIKLDGITKTYYPTYTKTVNGITVTYSTLTETFTLSGTPTATGSFNILSVSNPEAKSAFASAYYVGGNAMGCSTTVFSTTIGRTGKVHALKSVSAGETVNVSVYVTPNVPVQFDNYKFHASMDYVNNVTATSGALVDLHSTYSGLGTPTKTGYKFLGWYTQRSSGSVIADGSTVVNFGTPSFDDTLDRDVDIYAHWDPISYTVRYNGNGSTGGSTGNSVHIYDEAKNLAANGFYRKFDVNLDYCNGRETETLTATSSFLGWATSENGNKVYEDKQSVKNLTTEDGKIIDLYAKWAADSSVELPTPTMTGYTFDGWYTSDGTKVSQTFTPTAPTNLTAHWTPITYTVSYNGNGATSGETASSSHTYDVAKALTANGFKREFTVTFDYNYTGSTATTATAVSNFNGWAKTETGAAEYSDGASVTNLSSTDGDTVILYANWTDSTVKFPTPTRTGYDFSGWYNEAGQKVEETTVISENITLHAEWSIKSYTVTFKNGATVLQQGKWEYNTTPTYNEATPTKSKDDSYEYTFSGWSPEIKPVTADVTYMAQFSAKAHDYEYEIIDEHQHKQVCKNCGYEKPAENHKFTYVKEGNGFRYTCTDCGYSYTEDVDLNKFTISFPEGGGNVIKKEVRKELSSNYGVATIQAPLYKGSKYFAYWKDGATGEKVSTYRTYTFFMTGNRSFVPVYVEPTEYTAARNSAVFSSTVAGAKLNADGSFSLYAEHSVAKTIDGFPKYDANNRVESIKNIVSRYGVIYTTSPAYAGISDTSAMESVLVVSSTDSGIKDKPAGLTANTRDLTGMLEVVDTADAGSDTVWARTYVVDANGTLHYGMPKKVTINEVSTTSVATASTMSMGLTDLNIESDEPVTEPETPTAPSFIETITAILVKLVDIINKIIEFFTKSGVRI